MKFLKKLGNWSGVNKLKNSLKKLAGGSSKKTLENAHKKAYEIVTGHIDKQDLPWKPLKQSTVAAKSKNGYSSNILVRTHLYRDSIESGVKDNAAYVRVRPSVTTDKGDSLVMIAAVHEFGSYAVGIPARPLWAPSKEEFETWQRSNNRPDMSLLEKLRTLVGI